MTKFKTKKNYSKAINQVAQYVDQNYEQKLTLASMAMVANISEFHFSRIMQTCTGETPSKFLKRHRLYQAYKQLKSDSQADILNIALNVGYENHASFSRAFRKYFGMSPKDVSQKKHALIKPFIMSTSSDHKIIVTPDIVHLGGFTCYGSEVSGYADRSYVEAAGPVFKKLISLLFENNISLIGKRIGGIPLDNVREIEHDQCCFAAVIKSVDDLSHLNLHTYTFESGAWAIFNHIGPYSTLWQTWNRAYLNWIIGLGVPLRDAPAFEIYEHSPDTAEDERLTQIYIPIATINED